MREREADTPPVRRLESFSIDSEMRRREKEYLEAIGLTRDDG